MNKRLQKINNSGMANDYIELLNACSCGNCGTACTCGGNATYDARGDAFPINAEASYRSGIYQNLG